jgi:hypothetical protein
MVKLNIEMSMASLVVRLASGKHEPDMYDVHSSSHQTDHNSHPLSHNGKKRNGGNQDSKFQFQLSSTANKGHRKMNSDEGLGAIHCRTDLSVAVEEIESSGRAEASSRSSNEGRSMFGDEMPLGPLEKGGFKSSGAEIV